MDNKFYTYAYLRVDGTPYYIGKGCGNRCFEKRKTGRRTPPDRSRILILKKNLTEEEAFKHEIYMIAVYGRKDNGTGILRNLTNGGEGASGRVNRTGFKLSLETRKKLSLAQKGRKKTEEWKRKIGDAQRGRPGKKGEHCKVWEIVWGNGKTECVHNGLQKWCDDNGHSWSKLRDVYRGKTKRLGEIVAVRAVSRGTWQVRETDP